MTHWEINKGGNGVKKDSQVTHLDNEVAVDTMKEIRKHSEEAGSASQPLKGEDGVGLVCGDDTFTLGNSELQVTEIPPIKNVV